MPTEEEQKLLDILGQDEIPDVDASDEVREAVATAFPEMDDKQRDLMARVLQVQMPTPEEIQQAEEIARHNAQVDENRRKRLADRAARRAKRAGRRRKK